MANRIKIRRGSGNPGNNLLPYELGWDTTNKALYINDNGTSKITALPLTGGTMSGNLTFSGTAGIQYQGTKNTYKMISFIDNTSDVYGNGISIGGGGQTIIGGGESASALVAQAGTSGAEVMWIGNDADIDFYPTQQNGFDGSTRIRMSASTLFAGVSGNTAREAEVGVASGAGNIYMFSQAATSGARGIYLPAHGTGAAKYVIQVDTNNNITFYGSLSGTATKANGLVDGSNTMTSAYNKAGLAYANYTYLAGWNGYELRAVDKAQFAQASHTHSYLPLSGGTITGTLTVGSSSAASSSSHALWTTGITVHDTRYDAISVTSLSKAINFFFSNNGMPDSNWWAGMHVAGWTGDYNAWELVGPAHNSDQRTKNLYIRVGRTSTGWGSWRALVTSSDTTSRRIWVTTSSSYSSSYANGDIVLVKA